MNNKTIDTKFIIEINIQFTKIKYLYTYTIHIINENLYWNIKSLETIIIMINNISEKIITKSTKLLIQSLLCVFFNQTYFTIKNYLYPKILSIEKKNYNDLKLYK